VGSEILSPRQRVGSVPYSTTARNVSGGAANVTSLSVGGQPVVDENGRLAGTARYSAGPGIAVDDAAQSISLKICASGQILLRDDSTWQCVPLPAGTVTSVTGAAPLTVSNPTGAPQISIAQAAANASGYLSSADWSSFNARYGAQTQCAGDLSGPLSAPTVARLQSRPVATTQPVSGQVLKWSGAQWEPQSDSDSGGTVRQVTASAPLAVWNGSSTPELSIVQAGAAADGYLSSADWSRFEAKYGSSTLCGGDLDGNLSAPVVAGLQGVRLSTALPTSAQVLRFDGSRWAAASLGISDVGGLSSGYLDLSGNQTLSGSKHFAAAPTFGTPLDVGSGGTGATAATAGTVFAAPAGNDGAPSFRTLAAGDIPVMDASKLTTGTLSDARLSGTYASPLVFSSASNAFTGSGAGLTSLNASTLSTGTLPDGRLSGTYSSPLVLSSASNAFTGSGAALTSLNANALSTGTLPDARLSGTYSSTLTLSSNSNQIHGVFSGILIAADTSTSATGAIRFSGGHFQGYDGSRWLNLDNVPPPIISSLTPDWGSTDGGTTIVIAGSNFQALATVFLDGIPCTSIDVPSTNTITAVTPANSTTGPKDVKVQNPDFQSTTTASAFTYHKPPTISSVSPAVFSTSGGTTVTITGTDFVSTPGVFFGSTAATGVTFTDSAHLTAVAPAGTQGSTTVKVVNPDTLYDEASGYSYHKPPSVASASPSVFATTGGTVVTITGTDFVSLPAVLFGTTPATSVAFTDSAHLTVVAPSGTAGSVSLRITNPDGLWTVAAGYSFTPPPTVSAVSPPWGLSTGGKTVTVTGTNFATGMSVSVGGVACTGVNVTGATSLTAVTGTVALGRKDLVVTAPNQTSATLSAAFRVYAGTNLLMYLDGADPASLTARADGATVPSSTFTDLSGNGNHGSIVSGTVKYRTQYGGGLDFNGGQVSNYVTLPQALVSGKSVWTIDIWAMPQSNSSIRTLWEAGPGNDMLFYMDTSSWIYSNDPSGTGTISHGMSDGTVYHVAFVSPGASTLVKYYKDGASMGDFAGTAGNTIATTSQLMIGQEQDSAGGGFESVQAWTGRVYAVRYYTRALSAAEVSGNFEADRTRFGK